MGIVDIATLVLSVLNSIIVTALSIQSIRREKHEKINSKKKLWYQTEVISADKINSHIEALKTVLFNDSDKLGKCEKINSVMLDFFYSSVNYVVFLNAKSCEQIKRSIMSAIDDMLYAILYRDSELTERDKEKIIKVYRIKIMSLFYEFDIRLEENL